MSRESNESNPYESRGFAGDDSPDASSEGASSAPGYVAPPTGELLGHPSSLWMLFSTEFWERFCYYGMRAMLAVYVAETFFGTLAKDASEKQASLTYGGFTSLVYATGIFGGLIADRFLGYQRSILLGGVLMAVGMFMLLYKDLTMFMIGLSVMIAGNGLFKPNIATKNAATRSMMTGMTICCDSSTRLTSEPRTAKSEAYNKYPSKKNTSR